MINAHIPNAGATNNSKNCGLYIVSTSETCNGVVRGGGAPAKAGVVDCAGRGSADAGRKAGGETTGLGGSLRRKGVQGGVRLWVHVYNDGSHVEGLGPTPYTLNPEP